METRVKIAYAFVAIMLYFCIIANNLTAKQGALVDTGLYRGIGPTGFMGYTGGGNLLIPTPGTLPTPGVVSPPIMPNITPISPPMAPTTTPTPIAPGTPPVAPTIPNQVNPGPTGY